MIQYKNVGLSFSGKTIFDNLNISISQGENVCLSGSSGKGKSTVLNLLQGYVIPDEGEIAIDGKPINEENIKSIRELIISVPQNINLPVKNGLELMEMMHIGNNLSTVQKLMHDLGLEHEILHTNFAKISGGQKQRLVIAICLSLDKKIVLMDEPTSSLDDKSIKLLIDTISNQKDKTIVSASHNQIWADSADKIIEL